MVTKCRKDCEFYSKYTGTCDYTILMCQSRGCPVDACTKYKRRTGDRRSWNVHRRGQKNTAQSRKEYTPCDISEPAHDYITSLPTFDADTFYQLTGVRVDEREVKL